jgi:hypothetical protein
LEDDSKEEIDTPQNTSESSIKEQPSDEKTDESTKEGSFKEKIEKMKKYRKRD